MRQYEVTFLVSDEVLEKDHKIVIDRVAGIISAAGGKVIKEEVWGRRKLTYPIKKQNFATYITFWFDLPKEKISDIEHELLVYPKIIRHLIVVKISKNEELAVTKEDIVDTGDVEEILGEKSFEIIEGKTRESRNLMAKRGVVEETEELKNLRTKEQEEEKLAAEKPAETLADKPKKKATKKIAKEAVVEKPEIKSVEPVKEEIIEEKPVEIKAESKPEVKSKDNETDRIKKLDEKLDELLKDDL